MAGKFSSHVRSNVIGYLALFVALSGTAWAATQLPKNSVGPKQIKANAVRTSEAADNALTGQDVNEATLGQVPSALSAVEAQTATRAESADTANSAQNADRLDDLDSTDFLRANGKAADSNLLDGQDSGAFATANEVYTPARVTADDPGGDFGFTSGLFDGSIGGVRVAWTCADNFDASGVDDAAIRFAYDQAPSSISGVTTDGPVIEANPPSGSFGPVVLAGS